MLSTRHDLDGVFVDIGCVEGHIVLRLGRPGASDIARRELSLHGLSSAERARVLAIAIVELVDARLFVPTTPVLELIPMFRRSAREGARLGSAPLRRSDVSAQRQRRAFSLGIFSGVLVDDDLAAPLVGVRVDVRLISDWHVHFDVRGSLIQEDLGDVGQAWRGTVSSMLRIAWVRPWSLGTWSVHGGLRGGLLIWDPLLSEDPSRVVQTLQFTWFGPALGGAVSTPLTTGHHLELDLEGGLIATPVIGRVDGLQVTSFSGPWLTLSLGWRGGW